MTYTEEEARDELRESVKRRQQETRQKLRKFFQAVNEQHFARECRRAGIDPDGDVSPSLLANLRSSINE